MDDEFKLCWKNFQDNIASGFQNLYDRGDLVDVTLACDGKLLHAHKIVLAICSPYFQEIFITNPCKHPIIILKDVNFNIMCELLEFMYQGVVNVKHTELQSFMKIGQLLQIKGLATNASTTPGNDKSSLLQDAEGGGADENSSQHQQQQQSANNNNNNNNNSGNNNNSNNNQSKNNATESESPSSNAATAATADNSSNASTKASNATPPARTPTSMGGAVSPLSFSSRNSSEHHAAAFTLSKRAAELSSDSLSIHARKRRSFNEHGQGSSSDHGGSGADTHLEQLNTEEFFPPYMSMMESRYDLGAIKRESGDHHHHQHGASSSAVASSSSVAAAAAAASVAGLRHPFLDFKFYNSNNNNGGGGGSGGGGGGSNSSGSAGTNNMGPEYPNELYMPNDYKNFGNHMDIPPIAPGEHWFQGKLEFMLSQRGKPLLVHDGHTFGIQYVRKDKKYWQCNLSRKFNCKARVTTTDTGEIIVTNNEHCHTEIRQHLRKDYQRNKVMMNALINLNNNNRYADLRRQHSLSASLQALMPTHAAVAASFAQSSPIEEVVQNLHDHLAKASAEANESNRLQFQQQQLEQQQLKHENDEPLDCGIKHTMADVTRSLMINKANNNNDGNELPDQEWKCKNENGDLRQ